jgi:hypothetical protein
MKMFISGTVGAFLLLPVIGAGAQPQPPNVTPGALARFKLEAVSFHAISETGWSNWPGSDEIYVNIHDPARQVATRSRLFEGVQAGQTRDFPSDQSCILPIAGVSGQQRLTPTTPATAGTAPTLALPVRFHSRFRCMRRMTRRGLSMGTLRAWNSAGSLRLMITLAGTGWSTPWKS